MGPAGRLFGSDRLVVYSPAATLALHDLDGSRERAIRKTVEKFLESPESAFDKHPAEHIGHIRDLDTKTRAFATWCQNSDLQAELCFVLDIYRKKNERDYWIDLEDYNSEGKKFAEGFEELNENDFNSWVEQKKVDDSVILVLD